MSLLVEQMILLKYLLEIFALWGGWAGTPLLLGSLHLHSSALLLLHGIYQMAPAVDLRDWVL